MFSFVALVINIYVYHRKKKYNHLTKSLWVDHYQGPSNFFFFQNIILQMNSFYVRCLLYLHSQRFLEYIDHSVTVSDYI